MQNTIIQLMLENPRDAEEYCEFLVDAGYYVRNETAGDECSTESALLTIVVDATYEHTEVIDKVGEILNGNPHAVAIFRMPRNPAAPTWGEQFGLKAGFIQKDSGRAEFLSYLKAFIRISKLRFIN